MKSKSVNPAVTERLAELLAMSGVSYKTTKLSYVMDCPRCSKKDKVSMYRDNGTFLCYHCAEDGYKGKPEFLLADLLSKSVKEIRAELYGDVAPTAEAFFALELANHYSDDDIIEEAPNLIDTPTVIWPSDALPIEHLSSKKGADYLAGRGIPLDVAVKYGIRYSGVKTRVLFPIRYQGKLFGWQGRFVGKTEFVNEETGKKTSIPKALTSEGLKKDKSLMFADNIDGSSHIIVCEGPVDAIKMDKCGGAVATLGKAVSDTQVNIIKYSGATKVYLALDDDAAQETERLIKDFHPYMEVYQIEVPKGKHDFGDCSFEESKEAFLKAERVFPGRVHLFLRDPYKR